MSEEATIEVADDQAALQVKATTPGDVAARQTPPPEASPEEVRERTPDQYEQEIAKLRKENAGWRTKYREAEPIVKKHQELEEAQKSEVQRAIERAEAAERDKAQIETGYARLELAVKYNLEPDDLDFLGSGSREEMEDRAARFAARVQSNNTPTRPPSDRPVEGLRPGASPEPPKPEDNSYPAEWGFQPQRQS